MDFLTGEVMNAALVPLHQNQMDDLLSSMPEGAQLRMSSTLKHGHRVYALKDNDVYTYMGNGTWECLIHERV